MNKQNGILLTCSDISAHLFRVSSAQQKQLAEELGVSPSYLSQVRHGKRSISAEVLSVANSKKLCKLLAVNPKNTMWGRGDSNPHAFQHMILSHARLPIPTLPR